ncbi:hypothetical protein LINPERPRIM_LOCUS18471, partial [Linum perenne]
RSRRFVAAGAFTPVSLPPPCLPCTPPVRQNSPESCAGGKVYASAMRRSLISRIWSTSSSSLKFLLPPSRTFASRSANRSLRSTLNGREIIHRDFAKWSSLGFVRTSSFASGFTPLKPKSLESIIDVERAKHKSPEDLASAWDDYHIGRGHIGVCMKTNLYNLLKQRAADCKYFVIPLWRGSGYTTMFAQDATHYLHGSGRLQGEGNSGISILHSIVLHRFCR